MTAPVRVRIAPSPTGALHVGTARTALFNYLFTRQRKGSFILRIEDTDTARSTQAFEKNILDGLRWLGLAWDEGPDCGGPYGPYRQSERLGLYRAALEKLVSNGSAYPCYCSQQELEHERSERLRQGLPPVYSGKCKTLTAAARKQHERAGRHPLFRFAVSPGTVEFHDLVRGTVRFQADLLGDFSIARRADDPLYNFAVVVDDGAMNISHVIRGEDHLSNTPKQLLLFHALGLTPPEYGHVPLLLAPDRSKLSKRDAATSIQDYAEAGYLPEAVNNFLALLGWNPKTDQELFTLQELLGIFRIDHVQKAGAVFDLKKLNHINALHLRKLSVDELLQRAGDRLRSLAPVLGPRLRDGVELVRDRLTTLNDLASSLAFLAELPKYDATILVPKQGTPAETSAILKALLELLSGIDERAFLEQTMHDATLQHLTKHRISNADALWPLRVSLSGQEKSPGVFAIAAVLGKQESLRRLERAIAMLAQME